MTKYIDFLLKKCQRLSIEERLELIQKLREDTLRIVKEERRYILEAKQQIKELKEKGIFK